MPATYYPGSYGDEDPVRMNNLDALAEFKSATHIPIIASETLATCYAFRELLEKRAARL
jgi:galactonate dehydratase